MKIIEALKEIKALKLKADDLRGKLRQYCAKASFETSVYPDQEAKISEWLQSHRDTLARILKLQISLQKTNLATQVTIEIGEVKVTQSIAAWIMRRRELALLDKASWDCLTDKGIREGKLTQSDGTQVDIKVVRFFNQSTKDYMSEVYRTEPGIIDSTLETVNAVTELVE